MTAAPLNNEYAKRLQRQNAKRLHEAAPALLAAARQVLAGLNQRLDYAAQTGAPSPIFDGIAELHAAIAKAEGRT